MSATRCGPGASVIDSLVRQNHRAVCLSLNRRRARRPTRVDYVARIERRRLTLIVTRVPLAFVHVAMKLSVVDSQIVFVGRLHSACEIEVSTKRLAVKIQHV